ncbi:RNA polymerase sigma factor [Alicyclobacillus tolerans]|uniref:RNA polymerase sigma factor n=1 Tax=Alicyclobacillus tolerans TaxID=90970 RepID=UPI003B7C8BE8
MQQSDEALVAEIKCGSQSAMEVLIRRHYKLVFAVVYRKTGNYHLACDLTQDIFIKVAGGIGRYTGDGKFKNWLVTIAYNHCTDYFRSPRSRHQNQETSVPENIPDERMNVIRLLEKDDERQRVKDALMGLPEYQRDAIVLSYYQDMKIKDIANVMQCSDSTVKSRLHQGLKKLRKLLNGGDEHDTTRNHS